MLGICKKFSFKARKSYENLKSLAWQMKTIEQPVLQFLLNEILQNVMAIKISINIVAIKLWWTDQSGDRGVGSAIRETDGY